MVYQDIISAARENVKKLSKKDIKLSFYRLGSFIFGIAAIILLFSFHIIAGIIGIFLFLFLFTSFVKYHDEIRDQKRFNIDLIGINEQEINAKKGDFSSFYNGNEFHDDNHAYTNDLDIFGNHSIFQMICRCGTDPGKEKLRDVFIDTPDIKKIKQRHSFISLLKDEIEFRQKWQVISSQTKDDKKDLKLLDIWLKMDNLVLGKSLLILAIYLLPILNIAAFVLMFFIPWQLAIILLLPTGYLLKKTTSKITAIHEVTAKAEIAMDKYGKLIGLIENSGYDSQEWKNLVQNIYKNDSKASKNLHRLSYLISQLNVRYNIFAIFLNLIGLWDLQWVLILEKWKKEHGHDLEDYFNIISEVDMLVSLSTAHFNNPEWQFPKILTSSKEVIAKEMGHPLIPNDKRKLNDIVLPLGGHIKLITGSNMAGKSTFLRTLGINIIMAQSGLPVCASSFTLPLTNIFTSMRTKDDLSSGVSSFFAELQRLKEVISAVQTKDNVVFFLDEILKGTNSRDRHTGARALIKQLIEDGGSGLIATHDLELTDMEQNNIGKIENMCMDVNVEGEKLIFDYKIKKGISTSFNASILMKKMGVRIE